MKVSYRNLVNKIDDKPDINELSRKLFQLGHEHEIEKDIFNFELTPNRGDCLSVNGLLRDLNLFYKINIKDKIYSNSIEPYPLKFKNKVKSACPKISFLKLEVDCLPDSYSELLENYFNDLEINKNNFFTDISNYISYETGQPTHCYDANKFDNWLKLDYIEYDESFETIHDDTVNLVGKNLVFLDKKKNILNLAGVMGGKKTACDINTKSVVIECASFMPDAIIGKSVQYSINSDAAHKFERGTDCNCHDYVLRRFIQIVEDHTSIKSVQIFSEVSESKQAEYVKMDIPKINKILGTNIPENEIIKNLEKLGFHITKNSIEIPSFRNDVNNINDIAEEIARAVGYDNLPVKSFDLSFNNNKDRSIISTKENMIKDLLSSNGFFETINNPFVAIGNEDSIILDNPLDSSKKFLRTSLRDSLIENLSFNERRQKDTIKFFEISDIYKSNNTDRKRVIGIIASGRIDKNYKDFSKKITSIYIKNILSPYVQDIENRIEQISRENVNSKSKNQIYYLEIDLAEIEISHYKVNKDFNKRSINDYIYEPISDFPSSNRDLSFSIKESTKLTDLQNYIFQYENHLLREVYIFDYFYNEKMNEIKIGFRFTFQSKSSTITDKEINSIMKEIISKATAIESVDIPGLNWDLNDSLEHIVNV